MKRGPLTLCALTGVVLLLGGADLWSPWVVGAGIAGLVLAILRPRSDLSALVPPCVIALACLAPWRVGVMATATVVVAAAWSAGLFRRRGDSEEHGRQRMVPVMRTALVASVMAVLLVGHVTIERTVNSQPVERFTDVDIARPLVRQDIATNEIAGEERMVEAIAGSRRTAQLSIGDLGLDLATINSINNAGRDNVVVVDSSANITLWWVALAILVALFVVLWRRGWLPSTPGRSRRANGEMVGGSEEAEDTSGDIVAWYDGVVAARGHHRDRSEPILAHGRRIASETNDDRYRRLARVVSGNAYSGSPITREITELFGDAGTG